MSKGLFADTAPEAEAELLKGIGKKTPTQRLRMMEQINRHVRALVYSGVCRRYPNARETEVRRRLATILLGTELAEIIYGKVEGAATQSAMVDRERLMGNSLSTVTTKIVDILERMSVAYFIGGSVASAVHGVARSTLDSDIVADLRPEHIAQLVRLVQEEFYVSATAVAEAVALQRSFNLIHLDTMYKVDIFLPKDRPFDRAQFARATVQVLDEESGRTAHFASAEDTILAKLAWYRQGDELSDRQWQDTLGVAAIQSERLEWGYMQEMAETLAVRDLLDRLYQRTISSE